MILRSRIAGYRAALAQQPATAAPVAFVSEETFSSDGTSDIITRNLPIGTPLYTAPPAAEQPDTVPVPRELLEALLEEQISALGYTNPTARKTQFLLTGGTE